MEDEASFVCAYCLQINTIAIAPTGGNHQEFIEDCQVCCRPNQLRVEIHADSDDIEVEAEIP